MILSAAIALFASGLGATAIQHSADIYYHTKKNVGPSMWVFTKEGLTVYSPDGTPLRVHRKAQICPYERTSRSGQVTSDCDFFDVQSDGHQFVWAANLDSHRINVFDIDTADFAGHVDTCSTPLDLNYHPARREMWVRCAAPDEDSPGDIDVFSTNSLSSDHDLVSFNTTVGQRNYGRMQAHSETLGNVGYAGQYNGNYLSKFDLSDKEIVENFEIENGHAAYEVAYSQANEHVFAAVRVCCSCGSPGADLEDCPAGRGGGPAPPPTPVMVKTGPSARDEPQPGICSSSCKGSTADTIGVTEFDAVGEKFVANHNSAANNGCVPITSPDGKHILLLPFDGGKTVRVLKAGTNGKASTIAADIQVDFQNGTPKSQVVHDAAFVDNGSQNLIVIANKADNDVVIVDVNDNYRMRKFALSKNTESTSGNRQVEWAVGTPYVWINGGETSEMYLLDVSGGIDEARVAKTLKDVPDGKVAFVQNYARAADQVEMKVLCSEVRDFEDGEEGSKSIATAAPSASAQEVRDFEDGEEGSKSIATAAPSASAQEEELDVASLAKSTRTTTTDGAVGLAIFLACRFIFD